MENVLFANDAWIHNEGEATSIWTKAEQMTSEQKRVQDWWGARTLPIHGALEVHILNDLLTSGRPLSTATIEATLTRLLATGCDKEKNLAGQALLGLKEVRAGKQVAEGVLWGIRKEWGCFVSQDMQVGNLHYNVMDYGENILMDSTAMRTVGTVDRKEKNQCVILHVGAALAWHAAGRKKGTPPVERYTAKQ